MELIGEEASEMNRKIHKSEQEWRATLSPQQFHVMREKGTERPFSGAYWDHWAAGEYVCAGCGAPLFASDHKFDAGCGWPSFWSAAEPDNIETQDDFSHGMYRTEVLCQNCGAHLGHVFNDGPPPSGLRYCINSVSIRFNEDASGSD